MRRNLEFIGSKMRGGGGEGGMVGTASGGRVTCVRDLSERGWPNLLVFVFISSSLCGLNTPVPHVSEFSFVCVEIMERGCSLPLDGTY